MREEHWGPLEDSQIVRQLAHSPADLPTRVLLRAQWVAKQDKLEPVLRTWQRSAKQALFVLLACAIISGMGLATSALGDGTRIVNILWALGALLGLHLLTFMLWLLSFFWRAHTGSGGGLSRLWLWASRKLARGPHAALAPQALVNLLARAKALRWMGGALSHSLWLLALCAALSTLLILLSTASYQFAWATTLLEPDTFVRLTRILGWLPAQLGFPLPDEAVVRASDGIQSLPPGARIRWSTWLLGMVLIYGLVPRLLAWLVCLLMSARALRRLRVDMSLPGFAALQDRLQPQAVTIGIDRPAGALHVPQWDSQDLGAITQDRVLVGVELPDDIAWPPGEMSTAIHNAGNLDSREQRKRVLERLSQSPPARLVVVCDARQTPDRGTLALITELAALAAQTRIWLYSPERAPDTTPAAASRHEAWRHQLAQANLPDGWVLLTADHPLQWLGQQHD